MKASVSVVIPTFNEGPILFEAIDSVVAQEYAGSIRLIVVDGACDPVLQGELQEKASALPAGRSISYVANEARDAGHGFRIGFELAEGDFIMMCGSRTTLGSTHVEQAVALLERADLSGVAVVGGGVSKFFAKDDSLLSTAVSYLYRSRLGAGAAAYHRLRDEADVDTVYCGLYRSNAVREVGGVDSRFARGQDSELNSRLIARGWRVRFSPSLSCTYKFNVGFSGVLRRGWSTGTSVGIGWIRNPESFRLRHAAPLGLVFVLALLCTLLLTAPYSLAARVGVGLAATYGTVLSAEAVRISRMRPEAFLIPLVYAGYHISYGLGELRGMALSLSATEQR